MLFLLCLPAHSKAQDHVTFTTYKTDLAFTCIAVDSSNNIWAGTGGQGLWKFQYAFINYIGYPFSDTKNNFDKVLIKGLAADKYGKIWVAHESFNGSVATAGGVDAVAEDNPVNRTHYNSLSRITHTPGLPSRRTEGISIDKYGTIWTSHTYHDLTCSGCNPQYIVNPGGVGILKHSYSVFDTVKSLLPYPG